MYILITFDANISQQIIASCPFAYAKQTGIISLQKEAMSNLIASPFPPILILIILLSLSTFLPNQE